MKKNSSEHVRTRDLAMAGVYICFWTAQRMTLSAAQAVSEQAKICTRYNRAKKAIGTVSDAVLAPVAVVVVFLPYIALVLLEPDTEY